MCGGRRVQAAGGETHRSELLAAAPSKASIRQAELGWNRAGRGYGRKDRAAGVRLAIARPGGRTRTHLAKSIAKALPLLEAAESSPGYSASSAGPGLGSERGAPPLLTRFRASLLPAADPRPRFMRCGWAMASSLQLLEAVTTVDSAAGGVDDATESAEPWDASPDRCSWRR